MIQSAQVIIYGNQKHNYLNAIKAEQLMVGKELHVINKPIWKVNLIVLLKSIDLKSSDHMTFDENLF